MKEVNFRQKLYTLSSSFTDDGGIQHCSVVSPFSGMRFFKILGASRGDNRTEINEFQKTVNLLSGIALEGLEYQFVITGEKSSFSILVGVTSNFYDVVKKMYIASCDGIEISDINDNYVKSKLRKCNHGGTIIGFPSVAEDIDQQKEISLSDALIRGMSGECWFFCVSAKAIRSQQTEEICQAIRDELQMTSPYVRRTISGQGLGENEQTETVDYDAKTYLERLQVFMDKMNFARLEGTWKTSCFFASDSTNSALKLGSIIRAEVGGQFSVPYAVKIVFFDRIDPLIYSGLGLFSDNLQAHELSFLMDGMPVTEEPYCYFTKKYQYLVGSRELARLIGLPTNESPGYYINQRMGFDSAPRRTDDEFEIGKIVFNGQVLDDVPYAIKIESLTKHCLINGITGGGKSNTSKYLLTTLFEEFQIPFLVIESAKQEYYELGRILKQDSFMVFTLGYEGNNSVGYRINPFERIGNVSLQTHIDYLLASFKASFEMVPPMPYVLEASVYSVYKDYGWDIVNDINVKGRNDYPTLEDLFYKIEIITDEYGYSGEMRSNVISALQARIGSLRIGGKGAMLNVPKSYPIDRLLIMPTVLELDAIGDDDVKAFVISIILVQLYEYRKNEMKDETKKGLQHVLLIEEAHRLLKNVESSGEVSSQSKAVEFFCNMLAEIRSYGQGMFVSDQMPTKLAPDVLKNTNLKICHRIVTREDRELLGTAMNMNEEQIDAISMFKTGYAAIYSEGDSRPMLVKLPLMRDKVNKSRKQILENSHNLSCAYLPQPIKRKGCSIACSLCTNCKYKMKMEQLFEDEIIPKDFIKKIVETMQKCPQVDRELFDIIFSVIENDFVKRKMLNEEKLCFVNQIEDRFSASKAYIRKALIESING